MCLLYPDTATLPAWCWPKFFEQKTYNFNLDFDILCVKLNLKTYFITIFKSYKNSRCFAYADLGGQSDPQTVALPAIKRQTLSGTENLQKGVFYAVYEYVFLLYAREITNTNCVWTENLCFEHMEKWRKELKETWRTKRGQNKVWIFEDFRKI